MPSLLISNPPRRNRKGRFVKGSAKRRTRRRSSAPATSTAPARRRRASYTNPPRRKRSSSAAKMSVREMLPQAAAGVGGFLVTNYGTDWVGRMLPPEMTKRLPPIAAPLVKGAVAMTLGTIIGRYAPRGMRRFAAAAAAGGMISAGLDLITAVRSGGALSGYWSPDMSGYWEPGMGEGEVYYDEAMGAYYDPNTGMYLENDGAMDGPAILMDSSDLANL